MGSHASWLRNPITEKATWPPSPTTRGSLSSPPRSRPQGRAQPSSSSSPEWATHPLHKGAFLAMGPRLKGKSFMKSSCPILALLAAWAEKDFPSSFPEPMEPYKIRLCLPLQSHHSLRICPLLPHQPLCLASSYLPQIFTRLIPSLLQGSAHMLPPQKAFPDQPIKNRYPTP